MNDEQLIEQTLEGNRDAFGELVTKYQVRLYNTMIQVVGSAEDAYDVAQEAFLQAYLRLNTFRQTSKFYTWLYRIAFNVAMGIRRSHRIRGWNGDMKQELTENLEDRSKRPEEHLISKENVKFVQDSLNELDSEFRIVIILRELEEFSYEEIAEITEVPIGTVRSRLHRARSMLKERFMRQIK
ncbi:MAG: sigma-70 family RNA polymerase sigma factor [Planctomycetaceae bacterium]|nr:sigma-70 family RNA polymerase sigma factor [Planctomycetaceae bacterium]